MAMDLLDIGTILNPIKDIIDRIIPDKAAAAEAKAQLDAATLSGQITSSITQLQSVTVNQSDVDKTEASNSSMFVAGWRPAIGWVCAMALSYQYLIKPFATAALLVAGKTVPPLPQLDDSLWQLMFGMLGMGALRSYDKVKGTATLRTGP